MFSFFEMNYYTHTPSTPFPCEDSIFTNMGSVILVSSYLAGVSSSIHFSDLSTFIITSAKEQMLCFHGRLLIYSFVNRKFSKTYGQILIKIFRRSAKEQSIMVVIRTQDLYGMV